MKNFEGMENFFHNLRISGLKLVSTLPDACLIFEMIETLSLNNAVLISMASRNF